MSEHFKLDYRGELVRVDAPKELWPVMPVEQAIEMLRTTAPDTVAQIKAIDAPKLIAAWEDERFRCE